MAVFDKLISGLESDGISFTEKGRILGYAAKVLDDIGDRLADDDRTALADFAFRESDGYSACTFRSGGLQGKGCGAQLF